MICLDWPDETTGDVTIPTDRTREISERIRSIDEELTRECQRPAPVSAAAAAQLMDTLEQRDNELAGVLAHARRLLELAGLPFDGGAEEIACGLERMAAALESSANTRDRMRRALDEA